MELLPYGILSAGLNIGNVQAAVERSKTYENQPISSEREDAMDDVVIWGAGAIGGTIGAYLARAGKPALLVDQDAAHVAALNAKGLTITGPIDESPFRCAP